MVISCLLRRIIGIVCLFSFCNKLKRQHKHIFTLSIFIARPPHASFLFPSSLQTGRPSGSGTDLSGSVLVENEPATPSQSALGAPMMPQPSRTPNEPPSGPAPSISSKVRLGKKKKREISYLTQTINTIIIFFKTVIKTHFRCNH